MCASAGVCMLQVPVETVGQLLVLILAFQFQ